MPQYACFWFECFACDGLYADDCMYCTHRIDVRHPDYVKLHDEYQMAVDKALEPLHKEWKQKMEEYCGQN